MRAFRVRQDVAGWQDVEKGLKGLLAQNGENRMALSSRLTSTWRMRSASA